MTRDLLKKNTLEYAYQTTPKLGKLPSFGSVVRALGKGWKVCIITSRPDQTELSFFKNVLMKPESFHVLSVEEAKVADFSIFHLVLFDEVEYELISELRNSPNILGKSHVMAVEQRSATELFEYDLISHFSEETFQSQGVTAITGNGKGKTTSALGLAIQSLSKTPKAKIIVIQWFKEKKQSGDLTWAINEHQFPQLLKDPKVLEFFPTGLGFYGSPKMDRVKGDNAYQKHRLKAYEGLQLARRAVESGKYNLVVLDELIDTVKEIAQNIEFPLIGLKDLQEFLAFCVLQTKTPIVVTGRRVTEDWREYISRSIVITEVKHPWSSHHRGAVSGLDF